VRRALLAALLVAFAAAPAAEARSHFRLLGEGSVRTDGERYAMFDRPGQGMRVIDDALRQTYDLSAPPGCSFRDVAEGYALFECPSATGERPPVLMDIQTGATTPVPGWDSYMRWWRSAGDRGSGPSPPFPTLSHIGRHWIEASWQCYHCEPEYHYLNWRTGALVIDAAAGQRTRVVDLDDRDLDVPLCAPFSRRVDPAAKRDPVFVSPYLLGYDYQPPWGLPQLRRSQAGRRLVLDRCGKAHPITVSRCRPRCSEGQLGAGFLTWSQGSRVYSWLLSTRKRRHYRGVAAFAGGGLSVQHTRRTVYVNADGSVYAAPSRR
jgi:hypothetical protein